MDERAALPSDEPAASFRAAGPDAIGRGEQMATRIGFFVAGFATAAWAPLVVFAKARTGLSDGGLGLLLLGLGGGSIVAMPLAGPLAARLGCRRVLVGATLVVCLTLPFLATIDSVPWLGAVILLFGAGIGSMDCTINIQAVIVERASGRAMMSGLHGLFSVGGIAGAGGVSLLLSLGASPLVAVLCVVAVILAALVAAAPRWLSRAAPGGPALALPRGIVLAIGCLCFVAFLAEGAMLDWSAVFLTTIRGVDPGQGGLGYAAFAAAMTVGRLTGDRIVRRLGGARVMLLGGVCAAAGLALATLVPSWQAALGGFVLVGLGCSNIVPVLYTAVGRQTAMPEHLAVPAITTLGYAGILAGPALIGFLAQATSLSAAFLLVALSLLGVAAAGPVLERRAR